MGSSGNIHRVGWVIENANRPPCRSTRADSATAMSSSLTNCRAPNDENTTSKEASANGSWVAVPSTEGTRDAALLVDPARVLELTVGEVQTSGTAAAGPHPARALAGPGADLEHVAAGDVAENARLVLGEPLGAPDEPGVAEEGAMGGLVLVRIAVPVRPVGPPGLGLADRSTLHPHVPTLLRPRKRGAGFETRRAPLAGSEAGRSVGLGHRAQRKVEACACGLPEFQTERTLARYPNR